LSSPNFYSGGLDCRIQTAEPPGMCRRIILIPIKRVQEGAIYVVWRRIASVISVIVVYNNAGLAKTTYSTAFFPYGFTYKI